MGMIHRIIQKMRAIAIWLLPRAKKHPQSTTGLSGSMQNEDSTSDCLDNRKTTMLQPQVVRPSDITSKTRSGSTELPSPKHVSRKEIAPTQRPAKASQITSHKAVEQQEDAPHIELPLPTKDKKVSKRLKKPREIGGRRKAREQKTTTRQPPKTRPELICCKDTDSWQWKIILHLDDECQIKVAYQDGVALNKVSYGYCILSLSSCKCPPKKRTNRFGFPALSDDDIKWVKAAYHRR